LPSYRPPLLPSVALEVMALSKKSEVSTEALTALLEKDPLLAGRVLRLAHAPSFAGEPPVRSMRQAVARLGAPAVRDLLALIALDLRIFRTPGFAGALEQISRHSTTVAHLSRAVCRFAPLDGELAFLCGLLHDAGIAASLLVLAENPELRTLGVEHVLTAIEEIHGEATGHLARLWRLPPETCLVLERHHTLRILGHIHPQIAVLAVAEELALEAGGEISLVGSSGTRFPLDRRTPKRLEEAAAALRLNDKMLAALRKEAASMAGPALRAA
jgi:HD-like signal output (HDOD) protein